MKGELRLPTRYNVTFKDKSRNKSLITVSIENIKDSLFNKASISLSKKGHKKKPRSFRVMSIPVKEIVFDKDVQINNYAHHMFHCILFPINLISEDNKGSSKEKDNSREHI